ncbi:MAG: enterotoxin [Granulicella sp.]
MSSLTLLDAGVLAQGSGTQRFGNQSITATLQLQGGHLVIASVEDKRTHAALKPQEAFVLSMQDGREIRSSAMQMVGKAATTAIARDEKASRAAAHEPGKKICAELMDTASAARVHWCMIARGNAPYLRQEVTIEAGAQALPLAEVQLFHFEDSAAKVVGKVAGSPIVSGNFYLGFEHPLSYSTVEGGNVVTGLKRTLPLAAGQSITYSSVIGVAREGQLRRDFLAYVELERAHPYRTFLHYNSWYDLGAGNRYDAAGVLDRIHAFGEELVKKRGVTMDSFLMDDGWDNTSSLWGFNSGFPDGFAPVSAAAKQYGFGIGVWLSPWGGYSTAKKERIAYGTSQGYEIVKNGYALSGPKYYAKFEETCLNFITKYGVNQFKFDGTGNVGQVFPGSLFDSDFSAAIHLIERLRQQDSNLFINLTTGTKPSPFWLRYADSIWRSGSDHSFAGEGSWRQKWITYRDEQTYRNIVEGGPLFPINSLMLHGIIYAAKAEHLGDDPNHDFAAEVHSYFGTGTQLQEMYITPSLLSQADWDVLAESAKWSRKNAAILRDTHWVGGDPGKGEMYGWASWAGNAGILVLRNPSPQVQTISIDVQEAFELPKGAATRYAMRSSWAADAGKAAVTLEAHRAHVFTLQPFEVMTLESGTRR